MILVGGLTWVSELPCLSDARRQRCPVGQALGARSSSLKALARAVVPALPYLSDNITRASEVTCPNSNASQFSRAPAGCSAPRPGPVPRALRRPTAAGTVGAAPFRPTDQEEHPTPATIRPPGANIRNTPVCRQPHHPSGARSEERTTTPAPPWVGQIRGEQRGHFRVLQPPRVTFLPMLASRTSRSRIAMIRICSVALRAAEDPAAGLGHGHDRSVDGQVAVRHRQVIGRVQAAAVPAAGLALRAGLWTLGAPSGRCCRA